MPKDLAVKVRLEADTKDASKNIKKAQTSFQKFGTFLKKRFVFTLGDVQRALQTVFNAIQSTITLERQETALRGQLASMEIGFDGFINTLKKASNNTVTTANLIAASSRALLLGIPADKIADLLRISASRAAATGDTLTRSFDDITRGIGRMSPMILDNLGFVGGLNQAYEDHAAVLNKTVGELSQAEKKMALLNSIVKEGKLTMDQFGDSLSDTGTALEQGSASMENFKNEANKVVAVIGSTLAAILSRAAAGFVGLSFVITLIAKQFADLASFLPFVGDKFDKMSSSLLRTSVTLQRKMTALNDAANDLSASADTQAAALLGLGDQTKQLTDSQIEAAKAAKRLRQAQELAASEAATLAERTRILTETENERVEAENKAIESTSTLGEVTHEAYVSAQEYEGAERSLGAETDRLAGKLNNAANAAQRMNQATGGALTSRDRRSQADVDAALAAGRTPFMGGTRIRTADGSGSRLLGPYGR